jgi:transcriptional regulator with XRE-family HTH domain
MQIPTPDEIAAAAEAKGLSIAAMCRRADLEPSAFHRWKSGRNVTVETIQRMLDAIAREPVPGPGAV